MVERMDKEIRLASENNNAEDMKFDDFKVAYFPRWWNLNAPTILGLQ
jgi:hypothetical protein